MINPKYAVVIERSETSYGAYVPDLPGCIAVAKTKGEVEKLIAEAITLHLETSRNMATRFHHPTPKSNTLRLLLPK